MSILGKKRIVPSKAQEVLTQSDRLFRALIDKSSDIIVLANAEGTLTYSSSSITHIMGYTPEELVGTDSLALVLRDDLAKMQQVSEALRQSPGTSLKAEYRIFKHHVPLPCNALTYVMSRGSHLPFRNCLAAAQSAENKRPRLLCSTTTECHRPALVAGESATHL
jgi:PAS domain-containing protein